MDTYFSVYQTTNLVNGKTYIGAHKTNDPWDEYLGSGTLLKRAIKKHGRQSFTKEVLAVFDNPEDMWATEKRLVDEACVESRNTYNACIGGLGGAKPGAGWHSIPGKQNPRTGIPHTEETKQKMRDSMRGFKHSAASIALMKLRVPSEETKAKRRMTRQQRAGTYKRGSPSEETKAKRRITRQQRAGKLTEEQLQHLSRLRALNTGSRRSEEAKIKMRLAYAKRRVKSYLLNPAE